MRHRVDREDGLEQVVDNLVLALPPGGFNLANLGLSLLIGFVLGLLVALCVLCLELLELGLLLSAVRLNLLLGFVASFPHSLCAVFSSLLDDLGRLPLGIEQGLNARRVLGRHVCVFGADLVVLLKTSSSKLSKFAARNGGGIGSRREK